MILTVAECAQSFTLYQILINSKYQKWQDGETSELKDNEIKKMLTLRFNKMIMFKH